MALAVAQAGSVPSFWLRSRNFDLFFIVGVALLALITGGLMVYDAEEFLVLAQLNVLLLATPHVIATYTRIAFDTDSLKKHFFLVGPLPVIVIATVALLAYSAGAWLLATIYLYWQWWHYTRQSYGISRMYLSQARSQYAPHPLIDHFALYAVPFCGILYRSYQQPGLFLGMELYTFPVLLELLYLAYGVAAALLAKQVIHWAKAYREKRLPAPYLLYLASHYVVFTTGYLIIDDINYGWLVLNIWHNLQYMLFVWMYNNRHFRTSGDPSHKLLSNISREGMLWLFFFVCIFLAAVLNKLLLLTAYYIQAYTLLPWLVILTMSFNFHHYIVDAIVWRRKRRSVYA